MKRSVLIILVLALALFSVIAVAEEPAAYEELSKGSKGDAVVALQERLKELGYYTINVDGDYGNGTVKAINAFQARNGLEQDGTATVELQQLLFSDDAKKAPFEALVFPKALRLSSGSCSCRIQNNTNEKVDTVRTICIPFGDDGRVISDKAITYEFNLLTKDWGISETISSGRTGRRSQFSSETAGWECTMAKRIAMGVISYHAESGNTVCFAPEDVTLYYSDGTVQYPEGDVEPYIYSDEEAAEVGELRTGLTLKNIYPLTAEFYGTVEGLYILEVATDSLAERAGFMAGDIITAIDGKAALLVSTQHEAAKKILSGESAEYTYVRNGETCQVSVSMDMEPVRNDADNGDTLTQEDNLLRYGELLEKGFITQDEYDLLKNNLIGG